MIILVSANRLSFRLSQFPHCTTVFTKKEKIASKSSGASRSFSKGNPGASQKTTG